MYRWAGRNKLKCVEIDCLLRCVRGKRAPNMLIRCLTLKQGEWFGPDFSKDLVRILAMQFIYQRIKKTILLIRWIGIIRMIINKRKYYMMIIFFHTAEMPSLAISAMEQLTKCFFPFSAGIHELKFAYLFLNSFNSFRSINCYFWYTPANGNVHWEEKWNYIWI